eukprot:m.84095 g.84095  ORF g.84095 m.84095 type:complete len:275 (+) comp25708_c0_seq1:399-1223(+)
MRSCSRTQPTSTSEKGAIMYQTVNANPSLVIEMTRPANTVWGFEVTRSCCGGTKVNIANVKSGSIAQSAGLINGDSITAIDGVPIQHFIGQVALALHSKVAISLSITPRRSCRHHHRNRRCGQSQVADADGHITHKLKRCRTKKAWGVTLAWNNQTQSLIVATVACGHPASRSGIQKGDRIISINGQPLQYDTKAMAMGGRQLFPETTDKVIDVKIQRRSNWARASSQSKVTPPLYSDDATDYQSKQMEASTMPFTAQDNTRVAVVANIPPVYA